MPELFAKHQSPEEFAYRLVEVLVAAGHQAVWAGGCVRDKLLGTTPKDYDIATSATPDEVRSIIGRRRTLPVGEQFGVVIVVGPRTAGQVEIATFRSDGEYLDGRRPSSVEFVSAEEDAKRRDFTINGMFFDPLADQVIDYVGGHDDLKSRIVRAIGVADQRIEEDKLRMLRAARFAATLGFEIEETTAYAISRRATELQVVSAERIAAELRRMLQHENRAVAAEFMQQLGLLTVILPETDQPYFREHWSWTLSSLSNVQSSSFPLAFALLLRAIDVSAESAAKLLAKAARRQKLSNREVELAEWLVANEANIEDAESKPWPEIQRLLIHDDIRFLLEYYQARFPEAANTTDFCESKLQLPSADLNPPALIDGNVLKGLGIPPGAIYKTILTTVRDAQLLGSCQTPADAQQLAQEIANHSKS